jgi:hypothetical protein
MAFGMHGSWCKRKRHLCNCFFIKGKRAAQGRRSGKHCGRHKILGRFSGNAGAGPRRRFRFLFALKNSALGGWFCQDESKKLFTAKIAK